MRIPSNTRVMLAVAACLGIWGAAGDAEASSGTVGGRLMHFQNQGNFCPTSRDCTGAKYVQSQYRTYMPVAEVKVYIHRSTDNAIIGQGSTDGNGYFNISWYDPSQSGNVSANYDWRGEHKDNRFFIRDQPSGQLWSFWTWPVTLTNGGHTNFGSAYWGSADAPHQVTNLYDGAATMWRNSLGQTNRMWSYFTNVEIRSNSDNSYAEPWFKRVSMHWDHHFEGFVVMHEMGHIASHLSNRDQTFNGMRSYCFPAIDGTCDHSFESEEWAHASFEEGTATALAAVALYYPWATAPHLCRGTWACGTGGWNFESSVLTGNCTASHARRENNVTRYHWDNYDSVVDYAGENLQRGVWEILDTLNAFNNGTAGLQKDEHWGGDLDGRSARDFEYNWYLWGTSSWTQLTNNCLHLVGDL
jgi:hypothetical protein